MNRSSSAGDNQPKESRDPATVSRRVMLELVAAAGLSAAAASPLLEFQRAFAASGNAARTQRAIKHGLIASQVNTLANDYYVNWDRGARQVAPALGDTYRLLTYNNDPHLEIGQIGDLARSGVHMLFGDSATNGAVPALARAAQRNRIYYANIWDIEPWFTPPQVGDYWVQFQTPDSEKVGYEVAKYLFQHIGGKGTVLWISGYPGAEADIRRTRGVKRALKEFPHIKMVGGLPGYWDRVHAFSVMSDLVVRYPKFDAVYCQNDSEAIGAIEVLRIHNIHVPVAGMDGIKEGLQNIMAGKQVVSHLTIPGYQAGWAMAQIFDAYNGWKPTVPERMVFTGSILITKENAAHYYELVYKAPKLPFDWAKMSKVLHPRDWDPQNTIIPIDPFRYWGPPPAGTPTAALYQHAKKSGQFAAVTTMYASHFQRKL